MNNNRPVFRLVIKDVPSITHLETSVRMFDIRSWNATIVLIKSRAYGLVHRRRFVALLSTDRGLREFPLFLRSPAGWVPNPAIPNLLSK